MRWLDTLFLLLGTGFRRCEICKGIGGIKTLVTVKAEDGQDKTFPIRLCTGCIGQAQTDSETMRLRMEYFGLVITMNDVPMGKEAKE